MIHRRHLLQVAAALCLLLPGRPASTAEPAATCRVPLQVANAATMHLRFPVVPDVVLGIELNGAPLNRGLWPPGPGEWAVSSKGSFHIHPSAAGKVTATIIASQSACESLRPRPRGGNDIASLGDLL